MVLLLPTSHRSSFVVKNISDKNVDVLGIRLGPGRSSDLFVAKPSMTEAAIIQATLIPHGDIYRESVVKKSITIESSSLSTFRFDPDGIFNSMDIGDILHVNNEEGLVLDTPQWDDMRVPTTALTGGAGIKAPGFGKILDDGAASSGVFTYRFDADAEEELFFNLQMPHGWLEESAIRPHLHWMPTDASAGNVKWGLEYTKANVNEAFGNTNILPAIVLADGVANKQQIANFGEIDMTGNLISTMFMCRVFREATDVVNDTYAADAALIEVDFHYQIDTLGSRQLFIK